MSLFKKISFVFLLSLLLLSPLSAQTQQKVLNVGVSIDAPFSLEAQNEYTGIAIDLWKQIAEELNLQYKMILMGEHIDEAVEKLNKGEIDILIGPIVPTYARLKLVSFTQPYYLSQVGLVVPFKHVMFLSAFSEIFDTTVTTAMIILLVVFLIYMHIFWYYEIKDKHPICNTYGKGIMESFWLHTLGIDLGTIPTHIRTRQFRFIWLILIAIFFSSVTASITSALTIALSHQYSSFNNVDDFKNKEVAGVIHTAGYDLAKDSGFYHLIAVNNREEAMTLLVSGQVAAFVDYTPIASYYIHQHQLTNQVTTGNLTIQRNTFSFALPINSPLIHAIDLKIRSLQESGAMKTICEKYFGDDRKASTNCEI